MAKRKEKQRALELRKLGKSYSEIKSVLGVSKGTLSLWLKEFPLSLERVRELRDWNQKRIENYIATRRRKKEALLKQVYDEERETILPISTRELFVSGLFLYWGEGGKTSLSEISLSNTNPAVIKAFMRWAEQALGVDRDRIVIKLQLYSDMDLQKEMEVWAKTLGVPTSRFRRPYFKTSKFSSLTYNRGFGHGTCNVFVRNAILARKVMMGLKVIENYFTGQ